MKSATKVQPQNKKITIRAYSCRICGCIDTDCRWCIERTGQSCSWVEKDLCSACAHFVPVVVKVENHSAKPQKFTLFSVFHTPDANYEDLNGIRITASSEVAIGVSYVKLLGAISTKKRMVAGMRATKQNHFDLVQVGSLHRNIKPEPMGSVLTTKNEFELDPFHQLKSKWALQPGDNIEIELILFCSEGKEKFIEALNSPK